MDSSCRDDRPASRPALVRYRSVLSNRGRGGVAMKYLSPVCLAVALVALAVPGSAQTSLTPGQSAKIYRTVIPQGRGRAPIVRERIVIKLVVPMPLARKRIEDLPGSANSTLVNGALAV